MSESANLDAFKHVTKTPMFGHYRSPSINAKHKPPCINTKGDEIRNKVVTKPYICNILDIVAPKSKPILPKDVEKAQIAQDVASPEFRFDSKDLTGCSSDLIISERASTTDSICPNCRLTVERDYVHKALLEVATHRIARETDEKHGLLTRISFLEKASE